MTFCTISLQGGGKKTLGNHGQSWKLLKSYDQMTKWNISFMKNEKTKKNKVMQRIYVPS